MCGIAGYVLKRTIQTPCYIPGMLSAIRKRGPNDEGVCLIGAQQGSYHFYSTDHSSEKIKTLMPNIVMSEAVPAHDIALIQTRFSIIDLSNRGHQPFVSQDGNLIAIFNGEIYNYKELREELTAHGVQFRTQCDTEVLVEGYRFWSDKFWEKANGFWAVVLFDLKTRRIVFSRDRIGVAPLYYRETEEGLFFSSYLESILNVSAQPIALNKDSLLGFIQTGIKDHEHATFYQDIRSFPSRSFAAFDPNRSSLGSASISEFWKFPENRLRASDIDFKTAVSVFRDKFFDAVNLRLRSDVPLAFELSGGLDSSSVVAAASVLSLDSQITTFTAKIQHADEEPIARIMRKRYNLDYNVLEGSEQNFVYDHYPFAKIMEEPFDNPSSYVHHIMLRKIKERGIDVILTGAGGDEVLAGYESSFWPAAYRMLRRQGWKTFLHADRHEFCRRFRTLHNSRTTLNHYVFDSWRRIRKLISPEREIIHSAFPYDTSAQRYKREYRSLNFHQRCLYHFNTALVPFYMRSSDHFTMGIPIEHRFPFLDYRIVEFGLTMPPEYLFCNGWTKYLLRKAMEPYLPKQILWRRSKMGFAFPYQRYFHEYQSVFEPLYNEFQNRDFIEHRWGDYAALLNDDPIYFWRLLSTAIWFLGASRDHRFSY